MLGEVHPLATKVPFNPFFQAGAWHGLLTREDMRMIRGRESFSWIDAIELIQRRTADRGKQLLLRDWSHLDFTGVPWIEEPAMQLSTSVLLAERFEVLATATVRHPIDQWISLEKLPLVRGRLTVAAFMKGYRAFAERAATIGFLRFEDFTADPAAGANTLCQRLHLHFDPSFIDKWSRYTRVTGDAGPESRGRATHSANIRPLARRVPDDDLLQRFESSPDYLPALRLLGYAE